MAMAPPARMLAPSVSTKRPVLGILRHLVERQQGIGAQDHVGDLVALDLVGRMLRQRVRIVDRLDLLDDDLHLAGLQPQRDRHRRAAAACGPARTGGRGRRWSRSAAVLDGWRSRRARRRAARRCVMPMDWPGPTSSGVRGMPGLDALDPAPSCWTARTAAGRRPGDARCRSGRPGCAGRRTCRRPGSACAAAGAPARPGRGSCRARTTRVALAVPAHALRAVHDVVAVAGDRRDDEVGRDADLAQVGCIPLLIASKVFRAIHQVHLVDDDDDLADAEQVQQEGVGARLLLDALAGVDQHDRRVGAGGTGDHVLDELAMARRVDDGVVALRRLEPDLRGVDGDALVALRLERVHQEGPFERHAAPLAHRLDLLQLAVGQRAGVVEQAADQGRLAMVDMADDDDAHEIAFGAHRGAAHIYPVARRRSNASSVSRSMARPARSGVRGLLQLADDLLDRVGVAVTGMVMSWSPSER